MSDDAREEAKPQEKGGEEEEEKKREECPADDDYLTYGGSCYPDSWRDPFYLEYFDDEVELDAEAKRKNQEEEEEEEKEEEPSAKRSKLDLSPPVVADLPPQTQSREIVAACG